MKAEKTLQLMLPNENIRDTSSCKTQSGRFTASEFLEITVFALYEVQRKRFHFRREVSCFFSSYLLGNVFITGKFNSLARQEDKPFQVRELAKTLVFYRLNSEI